MPKSSEGIRNAVTTGEKIRQHADMAKIVIKWLQRYGLIKLYRVLSADKKRIIEIRLVLSPSIWTPELDLVMLSDGRTTVAEVTLLPTTEKTSEK